MPLTQLARAKSTARLRLLLLRRQTVASVDPCYSQVKRATVLPCCCRKTASRCSRTVQCGTFSSGAMAKQRSRTSGLPSVCWQGPLACLAYMADPQQRPTSLRPAAPCVWSAADLAAALQAAALPVARDAATGHCVRTPLRPSGWVRLLCRSHYEPQRAVQLVRWLREGVPIGYEGERERVLLGGNLKTADEQPQAVSASMHKELALGTRLGRLRRMAAALAPLPHLAARHRAQASRTRRGAAASRHSSPVVAARRQCQRLHLCSPSDPHSLR